MTEIEYHYNLISLQEPLMRLALKLTSDVEDAKDLMQDTFLKALKNCDKFVSGSNFKGWIVTIMKNTFINNYHRSVRYSAFCDHSKSQQQGNETSASYIEDPYSVFFSKELRKMIDSLDEDIRMPFKMHQEGFKYKEIADALRLNIGTVKSRIFFARRKLIKQLN